MLDMSRLFTSPEKLPPVAVGVCEYGTHRHVGIAFQAKGQTIFLHQAWHKKQRAEPIEVTLTHCQGRMVFTYPALDKDRAKAVAGFCRAIARSIAFGLSDIPYAYKYDPDACFDRHSGQLALPNGKGLTCATYVLVVFKSAQLPLIDFDGWPHREQDERAHEWLLEHLRNDSNVEREHIAAVEAETRCVRCRPEEAGGACLCIGLGEKAIKFEEASVAGMALVGALNPSQ